jgi:predicted RND superfamily exporter protein
MRSSLRSLRALAWRPERGLGALAAAAVRRPRATVALALALAAGGGALALGLRPSAGTDSFVGRSSADYRATQSFYASFGEEPIEVLVRGDLQRLMLGTGIERLLGLEGCLSGRVPPAGLAREGGPGGPCGRLAALHAVKVVIGPGTFVNEAAEEIDEQLARGERQAQARAKRAQAEIRRAALARGESAAQASSLAEEARKVTLAAYAAEVATLAARYGITSPPALDNPEFVDALIFDRAAPAGTPKRRFAYLFPNPRAALISVRLRAGLDEERRREAIALIGRAVRMPQWRLESGAGYLVTGEPVIVSQLTDTLGSSLALLLLAVVLVMACVLGLVFARRPVLLPLGVALAASAVTFGALALAGGSLTLGSLAVLPVLVGLGVDYAVQLQARTAEALGEAGAEEGVPRPGWSGTTAATDRAVRAAVSRGAPALAAAALACIGAMLALLLSPVPLVRSFGALLAAGVAIAFLCALTAGSAVLALVGARPAASAAPLRARSWVARAAAEMAAAWRGARELIMGSRLPGLTARAALAAAVRRPAAVVGVGLALAVLGWGLSTQTPVQTDITKLVPQNMSALENLGVLERETGVGGQVDVLLSGSNLTKPAVVRWMSSYQAAVLRRFGSQARASAASGSTGAGSTGAGSTGAGSTGAGSTGGLACAGATLCPAFSLPDLFAAGEESPAAAGAAAKASQGAPRGPRAGGPRAGGGGHPDAAEINALLSIIPPYFSQDVITADRRHATLAFGIRLMPLDRQQRVIEAMRGMLHPPAGVTAQLAGLAVLAAQADAQVASPGRRGLSLLISLLAVAAVLLVVFRGSAPRTLVAVLPVALASGWSELVLFLTRVPLNPMSASLSILVVAISTELSVLLAERYREQRLLGEAPLEALRATYARTGAALAVSGVTATAGFAVLALSRIRMLQDFGVVTLVDLAVSLVGVLIAFPSVLAIVAEPHGRGLCGAAAGDQRRPEPEGTPGPDEPIHALLPG